MASQGDTHSKHLEQSLLGDNEPLKLLFLLDSTLCDFLEGRVICRRHSPVASSERELMSG